MNRTPPHPITDDEIRAYNEDGVVCIDGQFDSDSVVLMREASIADTGNPRVRQTSSDGPGRVVAASHMARNNPVFMDFIQNSSAAEISARLLGTCHGRSN